MQNKEQYLVSEFAQAVRTRVGDTSRSISIDSIITYMNTALRRLVRQEGLERIGERTDTWELAYLNKDGTPSASWDLGKVGKITNIETLRVLKTVDGKVCDLKPKFVEYDEFNAKFAMPEQNKPGDPDYYTYEQIGSITRLVFNRPPRELLILDMKYSATFPRLTNQNDPVLLAWEYCDILEEYVIILSKIESTDNSTARALYEDLDVLTSELVELLARNKNASGYRRIARSW